MKKFCIFIDSGSFSEGEDAIKNNVQRGSLKHSPTVAFLNKLNEKPKQNKQAVNLHTRLNIFYYFFGYFSI